MPCGDRENRMEFDSVWGHADLPVDDVEEQNPHDGERRLPRRAEEMSDRLSKGTDEVRARLADLSVLHRAHATWVRDLHDHRRPRRAGNDDVNVRVGFEFEADEPTRYSIRRGFSRIAGGIGFYRAGYGPGSQLLHRRPTHGEVHGIGC